MTIKLVHRLFAFSVAMISVGCGAESYHSQAGWKAEDYFPDPKVQTLCNAIEANDIEAVREAVERGAKVDTIGKQGMTPLLWAFPEDRVEIFQWLAENGADPNVCLTGDLGSGGHPYSKGVSVTNLALITNRPDYYRIVMENGGDPNLRCDGQRETLIHSVIGALVPEKVARVAAMLDAGVDINVVGRSGTTPVMRAAAIGEFGVARLLLDRGADVSLYQENFSRQVVHFVIGKEDRLKYYSESNKQAYKDVCRKLREAGVDFEKAQQDLKRWKSWGGKPIPEQKKLREREIAERKAREAAEEKRPDAAEQ